MKLEGRAAIVTGGNRGIGRAIALEFARQGADVAFNYRGDEASAKATASEIEGLGRKDLGSADQRHRQRCRRKHGGRGHRPVRGSGHPGMQCGGGVSRESPGRNGGPRDASVAGRAPVRRSSLRKGSAAVHENPGAKRRPLYLVHVALQKRGGARALRHRQGVRGNPGDDHGKG